MPRDIPLASHRDRQWVREGCKGVGACTPHPPTFSYPFRVRRAPWVPLAAMAFRVPWVYLAQPAPLAVLGRTVTR